MSRRALVTKAFEGTKHESLQLTEHLKHPSCHLPPPSSSGNPRNPSSSRNPFRHPGHLGLQILKSHRSQYGWESCAKYGLASRSGASSCFAAAAAKGGGGARADSYWTGSMNGSPHPAQKKWSGW